MSKNGLTEEEVVKNQLEVLILRFNYDTIAEWLTQVQDDLEAHEAFHAKEELT